MTADRNNLTAVKVPFFFLPMAQQPLVGQGFLIIEASRSHSDTSHSVGLLWTSDQPRRRDLYLTTHNIHKRQTFMPPGGIRTRNPSKRVETGISAVEVLRCQILHCRRFIINCVRLCCRCVLLSRFCYYPYVTTKFAIRCN
jgi:hypothetical protein